MKAVESIVIFIFLVFFASCIEDALGAVTELEIAQEKLFPNVDRELWTHFRAFEEVARERGFNIDLSQTDIYGSIENIDDGSVVGSCSYGGRSNHKDVLVDRSFWELASHAYREYIVFHELGHCYLFRDHLEACFNNRTYVSIMRSGNGGCRDNYTSQTRDYYVDELLEPLYRP